VIEKATYHFTIMLNQTSDAPEFASMLRSD